jgi:hypothetical protein
MRLVADLERLHLARRNQPQLPPSRGNSAKVLCIGTFKVGRAGVRRIATSQAVVQRILLPGEELRELGWV